MKKSLASPQAIMLSCQSKMLKAQLCPDQHLQAARALTKVFATDELVEMILLSLPIPDIVMIAGTNESFRSVIEQSKQIHKRLYVDRYDFLPDSAGINNPHFVFLDFYTEATSPYLTKSSPASLFIYRHHDTEFYALVNHRTSEDWKVKILNGVNSRLDVELFDSMHGRMGHGFNVTLHDLKTESKRSAVVSDHQKYMAEYLHLTRLTTEEMVQVRTREERIALSRTQDKITTVTENLAKGVEWASGLSNSVTASEKDKETGVKFLERLKIDEADRREALTNAEACVREALAK